LVVELEHRKIETRRKVVSYESINRDPDVCMKEKTNVVYYESIKREVKMNPIYECRCDGRLQTKRFTRLSYTGLVVELEHLKIKTRLTNEKFPSVKGECEI
jgi:hypothetical protein